MRRRFGVLSGVFGSASSSVARVWESGFSTSIGQIPAPKKPYRIFFSVIAFSEAILYASMKRCFAMGDAVVKDVYLRIRSSKARLRGPKTLTSSGCVMWDEWGGK